MKEHSTARKINGIVSAIIVCLFLIHATLGSLGFYMPVSSPWRLLLWAGVVLVGLHVVVSAVTSVEQLTDQVRPPSAAKKRHLVLKWATGLVLGAFACFHIVRVRELSLASALHSPIGTTVIVVLAIALGMHIWTGSKSLLKDLNIDRRYRSVVRAIAAIFAALFVIAAALNL